MNVLMLSREYPPHVYGGAGVVVDELSRALARRAHVEVRCFGAQQVEAPELVVRGYGPWERLASEGQRYAPSLQAMSVNLAMVTDPTRAEVVHTHTWYAGLGGVLARALFDIPLVVTLHSLEPLRPWKQAQLGTGYAVSSWLERMAVERADRVIAVSAQMRADVLGHFGVDPARVAVVGNGVDADMYRRTDRRDVLLRHGLQEPYALFVGRISEQKGIFPLLEAADGLPASTQLVLCAAAPDTPEIEARLRQEVARRPRVRWIPGMVPREEVVQLLSHAALFVAPSIYEPFGIMNLEAMACETPVVSTRVGGIPEVVTDGETGLLVPPADPDALSAAMRGLLADRPRAAEMGRAGRRRVEEHFSWDRIADRTLGIYAEAIAAYRSASER